MLKKCRSILAASLLSLGLVGCRLPSDSYLEKVFHQNQDDFNRLAAMAEQDNHALVIRPWFVSADSSNFGGISQQRWDEYRRLFRKLGLNDGLVHRDDFKGALFFTAESHGLFVTNGEYKGYAYWDKPLSPLVSSLDNMPRNLYDNRKHALAFKPLGGNWYLYREEF
jgi:hypothetical protein